MLFLVRLDSYALRIEDNWFLGSYAPEVVQELESGPGTTEDPVLSAEKQVSPSVTPS
jgi:hypothetical protein